MKLSQLPTMQWQVKDSQHRSSKICNDLWNKKNLIELSRHPTMAGDGQPEQPSDLEEQHRQDVLPVPPHGRHGRHSAERDELSKQQASARSTSVVTIFFFYHLKSSVIKILKLSVVTILPPLSIWKFKKTNKFTNCKIVMTLSLC